MMQIAPSDNSTTEILGYSITSAKIDECVSKIYDDLNSGQRKSWLACINPHSYVVARSNHEFRSALSSANFLMPDGIGIVLASKLLGGAVRERIAGYDIFVGVMSKINKTGGRVFFLGSTENNLDLIEQRANRDYPNVTVAGTFSPPFKDKLDSCDTNMILEKISAANVDVLWVGMTAPKQEIWLYENISKIDAPFAAAVGAVFDFYSGAVKRSSPIFIKTGTEWLPRLIQQPRRLWRRVFVSAPIFLWDVLLSKVKLRAASKHQREET